MIQSIVAGGVQMKFKQLNPGFMKKYEGTWKVTPVAGTAVYSSVVMFSINCWSASTVFS